MDIVIVLFLLLAFFATYALPSTWNFRRSRTGSGGRLPPGPFPLPIIGSLHKLGKNPNQSLAKLAKKYGPLMSLKLGNKTTIVVSSPSIAKQVLQEHDQILSSRTILNALQPQDHHKYSMLSLPASGHAWRKLRKISKEHMFSTAQLDSNQNLRQEKLKGLREYLHNCSCNKQFVNIGESAFTTSLNLISTTLFSIDFATYDSNSSQELKEIVWGIMEMIGTPNLADYFPALRFLDPQGIFHKNNLLFRKIFELFDDFINERQLKRDSSNTFSKKNDFLQALLDHSAKNESEFSRNYIKHMLLDLFVAGTNTTSVTVEWAMAELLRSPEKMEIARAELHQVIEEKETVNESDISKLPYLQAIVKETFRLHPAAPLLAAHKADADVEINDYVVPKNAHILVNVWASNRNSETWFDPNKFSPERFLNSDIDVRGKHFDLIPFGAGRRICPGMPLAYRMVHLMLAAYIHQFDWKLEYGMRPKDIDMKEKFGLTVQKAMPLVATPIKL